MSRWSPHDIEDTVAVAGLSSFVALWDTGNAAGKESHHIA
eukprot:CAMPEP_0198124942 /NCGR_PEP_ID=MMETSP1442-20131203/41383_1 /TAXON_ID= /ORGANISM="Craspedostauros australis, Strain CCMP3328" /LENGTH=39 /DNA_ID= /DNA_START= /DNA_END= /DNA_ORIENTATION=